MDPWTRDQLVSQRNMMQGMAQARVPAAYPVPRVRLPRMLGGLKGSPPTSTPPSMMYTYAAKGTGLAGAELPVFPEGMTSAVALAACSGASDLVLPAGWDVILDCGPTGVPSGGGRIERTYVLSITNPTGAEGREVHMTEASITSGWGATTFIGAYCTGGSGGSWQAIDGGGISGAVVIDGTWYGKASPTDPGAADVWVQMGVTQNVYIPNENGSSWYGSMLTDGNSLGVGYYLWPNADGAPMVAAPWTADLFWGLIGIYGAPNSRSVAAVWVP